MQRRACNSARLGDRTVSVSPYSRRHDRAGTAQERKRLFRLGPVRSGEGIFRDCEARCELTREHTEVYVTEVSERRNKASAEKTEPDRLRLYGQANKRIWWMPRRQEAMKDVVACEKLRGVGKQTLIRRCPNGETRPACGSSLSEYIG